MLTLADAEIGLENPEGLRTCAGRLRECHEAAVGRDCVRALRDMAEHWQPEPLAQLVVGAHARVERIAKKRERHAQRKPSQQAQRDISFRARLNDGRVPGRADEDGAPSGGRERLDAFELVHRGRQLAREGRSALPECLKAGQSTLNVRQPGGDRRRVELAAVGGERAAVRGGEALRHGRVGIRHRELEQVGGWARADA